MTSSHFEPALEEARRTLLPPRSASDLQASELVLQLGSRQANAIESGVVFAALDRVAERLELPSMF